MNRMIRERMLAQLAEYVRRSRNVSFEEATSMAKETYMVGPDHHDCFLHEDQVFIDAEYRWSIFTMYWPGIAFYALIGQE